MNKQEIMIKYTKLVAKRLYNHPNVKVYFNPDLIEEEKIFCGQNNMLIDYSIIYNENVFSEDDLYLGAWNIIVHEITHVEVLGHGKRFWKVFYKNLEKVEDLKKEFNKEVGWYGDFDFDFEDDVAVEGIDNYDYYLRAFDK